MNDYLRLAFSQPVKGDNPLISESLEAFYYTDLEEKLTIAIDSLDYLITLEDLINSQLNQLVKRKETVISIESLNSGVKWLIDQSVFESLSLEHNGLESTSETIKSFLIRAKAQLPQLVLEVTDQIKDLLTTGHYGITRYQQRLNALFIRFNTKKNEGGTDYPINLKALGSYWFTKDGYVEDFTKQLALEEALVHYVLMEYRPLVYKAFGFGEKVLLDSLRLKKGEFEAQYTKELEALTHPADLFDTRFLGERRYLYNTQLSVSRQKKTDLQRLSEKRTVKISSIHYLLTVKGWRGSTALPKKHTLTTDELSELFKSSERLIDLSHSFFKEIRTVKTNFNSLANTIDLALSKNNKESLDNKSNITLCIHYNRNLVNNYWLPSLKMAKRTLRLIRSISHLLEQALRHDSIQEDHLP